MSIAIGTAEIGAWAAYIKEICGINLDATKGYLIETRLGGLLKETGSPNFGDLLSKVKADFSRTLRRRVIDNITTNETSFFRDAAPFELLKNKLFPECIDRKNRTGVKPATIRIWSAASSTGQEAYSTAIILKELLGDLQGYDIRILGTDISDRAVSQASYGAFSQFELERGLGADRLARYFTRLADGKWKVRDEIRAMATFRHLNLLEPFSFPQPFDLILCRNVAIYFTDADRVKMFRNIGRCLERSGALIIGATESLTGLCPEFEPKRYLRSVFYQSKSVA